MTRTKRLVYDAKTKEMRVEEFEFGPRELEPEPEGVDLEELRELLRWREKIIQPQLARLDQRLRVLEEKLKRLPEHLPRGRLAREEG